MSLTTRCHAHHSMEQRLCRWLLRALDRAGSNELRITHELTRAVTELDRGILEALTCECYAALKRDLDVMARDIAQL